MAKGVRVPEKAFGVVMWVVSVVLAAFIVGLGNLVIGDLPQVESQVTQEQFADSTAAKRIREPVAEVAAAAEGSEELVDFIGDAVEREREGGHDGDLFPGPGKAPAQRGGEDHAASRVGGEVQGLVPKTEGQDALDFTTGERGEVEDRAGPEGGGEPGEGGAGIQCSMFGVRCSMFCPSHAANVEH